MNKRLRLVVCIMACIFTTTGCASESIYSEREEEVIADYVAQIVFKHAEGYNYRLEEVSKNPFIREEIDETEESAQELLDKEINDFKEGESQTDTVSKEDEVTISQALGFDENIKVEVMKTKIVDDLSKGAYYLKANKGEKLAKIEIKITNVGKKKTLVEYNKSLCKLIIDKNDYTPLMTAIENDFQFLSKKLDKEESILTTLVYSIDKDDEKKERLIEFSTKDVKKEVLLD